MTTTNIVAGKVVVVTGAGGGIGRDLALALAAEGATEMSSSGRLPTATCWRSRLRA